MEFSGSGCGFFDDDDDGDGGDDYGGWGTYLCDMHATSRIFTELKVIVHPVFTRMTDDATERGDITVNILKHNAVSTLSNLPLPGIISHNDRIF